MDVYDSAEVFLRVKGGVVVDQYSKSNDDGMVFTVQHKDVNVVIEFKDVDEDGTFAGKQSFDLCVFGIGTEVLQSVGSPSSTIRCKIVIKTEEENSRCILHVDKTDFYLFDTDFTLSLTLKQDGGGSLSIKTCADSESGFLDQEGSLVRPMVPAWRRRLLRKVCEDEQARKERDTARLVALIPDDKSKEWYQKQMDIASKDGDLSKYRALRDVLRDILEDEWCDWNDVEPTPTPASPSARARDDDDGEDVARAPSSTLEDRMAGVEDRLALYHDQLEKRLITLEEGMGTIMSFIEQVGKGSLAQPPPMDFPSRSSTPDSHLYVA